ncbi:monooxygenase [Rhodococcus sp. ACS1]|uniref:FAD binding domain-containing protein n=1 Tax=Rhodococcus sp. ACS1 TaxID=2028570 RepID=UPI000BB15231|nr:FAD-dependent monooxygenase [Rhodococcus sp. ACS1]PBC35617.1 monooxygenase [Rhodococcus sp. ACS1]
MTTIVEPTQRSSEPVRRSGRAVIVGGSLGGLHAAAVLQSEGWEVDVFERSPQLLDGAGAGIVAHSTLLRILVEHNGVDVDAISCTPTKVRTYSPTGESVTAPKRNYRLTSWTTIYRELLKLVTLDNYHLAHNLASIEQTTDGVTVGFESGLAVEADLVVCADGISSTARNILGVPVETTYSGYVGWRGVVDPDLLDRDVVDALFDSISFGSTGNSHIVAYPIPFAGAHGRRALNYVWYRPVPEGVELDALMTDSAGQRRPFSLHDVDQRYVDEMRAAANDFSKPLAQMVSRTPNPFLQVIVDQTASQMVGGRVAILGDAASVARPHAAAGTAKAAENGWQLAASLRDNPSDIAQALSTWERSQIDLGETLIARSRELGTAAQCQAVWSTEDPAANFGLYGAGR